MSTWERLTVLLTMATLFCMMAPVTVSAKPPPLQKSASYGDYTAEVYFDPSSNKRDAYFTILKNKKPVYRQQATENGERFVIGTLLDDDPDAALVTMGRDITGDGQPDLLISEWTGGANCCLILHIFEIGSSFRKIADIDAEFGDQGPHFVELSKGPGLQVQIYDWTFANWHSDFADSPAPKVILRYQDRKYRVAPDLMRTPSVDSKDLAEKTESVRVAGKELHGSWPDAEVPPQLWGTMLDLMYSGHSDAARQFLDDAWPKQVGGKDAFRRDFDKQLRTSPYWKQLSTEMRAGGDAIKPELNSAGGQASLALEARGTCRDRKRRDWPSC